MNLNFKTNLIINKVLISFVVCLFSLSAHAAGGGSDSDGKSNIAKSSDYNTAMKLIKNKSYNAAIQNLLKAEQYNKKDADIYNYLGFSHRKIGDLEKASIYYNKALTITPKHKGALEYQGEMFLTLGQLANAEANLKKLGKLCFLGCKEEKMLKESILKFKKGKKSNY